MGRLKFTNEKVDEILSNNKLKRIDDYINSVTPFKVQCLVDGFIFSPLFGNIIRGHGCPRCNGCEKYNNESFDEKIKNSSVIRIGEYKKGHVKINFKCKKCENVWESEPYRILQGKGCPKCNGGVKMTSEEFDKRIKDKGVIRIGEYISNEKPIKMKCLKDGHEWIENRARNILKEKTPCPKCPNLYKTAEEIDKELSLSNPNIERIDPIIRMKDRISFKCKIDGEVFQQSPIGILWHGYGCPFCKKKREKFVKNNLLEFYGNKVSCQSPIKVNEHKYIVDFVLKFHDKVYYIEYNGKQHYEPVRFGGMSYKKASDCFEKQKQRDNSIKEYCQQNGIHFVELPYWLTDEEVINKIRTL